LIVFIPVEFDLEREQINNYISVIFGVIFFPVQYNDKGN